ncbi:hypothetical protein AAFF_G00216020 [Aldrovandia affinis]|uniref:Uncharacterized protein n=1 Tax=Aldrovandia affinis TaxID=143900 RepID=A0AAD7RIZ2_9TELE|nr:hypothetical protein AAFF_G00216020 [Aldrovandia affinis]
MLFVVLLLAALHAAAQADEGEAVVTAMTVAPPVTEELSQVLSQLVQQQKEMVEVLQAMRNQGVQQLTDLRILSRHQSLLVENNQALLLQVSRIANLLQDLSRKLQSADTQ